MDTCALMSKIWHFLFWSFPKNFRFQLLDQLIPTTNKRPSETYIGRGRAPVSCPSSPVLGAATLRPILDTTPPTRDAP